MNFKKNTITILHTAIRVETDVQYANLVKQQARFRSMPIPKSLRRYLEALYQHQQQMKVLFGAKYHDNDYICKRDDGNPLKPNYVTQQFRLFLKKKGLKHITFHQLRHAYVKHRQTKILTFFRNFHIWNAVTVPLHAAV